MITRSFLTALIAVVALAGCATGGSDRPMPRYAYKQYPPINVQVANIVIQEQYVSPMGGRNAEHLMPQPLPQAVAEWARTRFVASGADGTLTITIRDASLVAQDLPRTDGVKGWFTVDQAQRYNAKIAVEFTVDGLAMGTNGNGMAQVSRGQTIAENATLQTIDQIWVAMTERMITDLDAGTQRVFQEKLPFLVR